MKKIGVILLFVLFFIPTVFANSYLADLTFTTSKTIYNLNESIELRGVLQLANYTDAGVLVSNFTGIANATLNFTFINSTNNAFSSYLINTTTNGIFYSRSTFFSTAPLLSAPLVEGSYYLRINYTDPNATSWSTQSELQVLNQTIDRIYVSSDKLTYTAGETVTLLVEAVKEVSGTTTFTSGVVANGTIRDSSRTNVASFSCITGSTGKCSTTVTAPSTLGEYLIEVNNFKAYSLFEVRNFNFNVWMKDELGQSLKSIFALGEQGSVEVNVLTSSTSETYTFNGIITNSSGSIVKTISSTTLDNSNTYTNRFTFSVDSSTFRAGTYVVEINITKSGGATISTSTGFEVKSWDLTLKKREVNSGFDSEYKVFPNKNIFLEIYPTFRSNGSVLTGINTSTSMNITLLDEFNNQLNSTNATWNATCGREGCYDFSLVSPSTTGSYYLFVLVSSNNETQSVNKRIQVVSALMFATTTDKDGNLKELFNGKDYAYLTITGRNATSSINITNATIISIVSMNGTEINYTRVSTFDLVNTSNTDLEWAWNLTLQRLKIDTPLIGGSYQIYITSENNTAATSTRIIVNPYEVCSVAKTSTSGSSGSYYAYQFKTTDTVYFELNVMQALNPLGRAPTNNNTLNSQFGMGSSCMDQSSTRQTVTNATITLVAVTNTETGETFSLNTSASVCQSSNSRGSYSCTVQPSSTWDGGNYQVKFKIVGPDGQTDFATAGFEAKAFYLYAYPSTWRSKPGSSLNFTVSMYQAGSNWWSNYGSAGLSGTVKVERIEYQGREGEWLWPPISYNYTTSNINISTVTNGRGNFTLPVSYAPGGQWKTGYYRAILKGTDTDGNIDYGYAWFEIRQWEVYATPVECNSSGGNCVSLYNLNSKNNVSLYVTINNAGEWGQSATSLGGNVTIRIKKIQDCRSWPCKELNSTSYSASTLTVNTSSGWYWSGNTNTQYILSLNTTTGTWGTGYWQVVFDINGTETGSGWFNTIAFYVEVQPTDESGNNWKYVIKNADPMYFTVKSLRSQKSGSYYTSYNTSDYLNTTISDATLRTWNTVTYATTQYMYPTHFNISLLGGGSTINGTKILNFTSTTGSWASGSYYGELTLKNIDNETATGWLWFQVKSFRVDTSLSQSTIGTRSCFNVTVNVREPDWNNNNLSTGNYTLSSVTERIWSGSSSSLTTYTNYTPSSITNGTGNITLCPNNNQWASSSWSNWHYLTLRLNDTYNNSEETWLSFNAVPFSVSWGSIINGTTVLKTRPLVIPVNLTTPGTMTVASGNLTNITQWISTSSSSSQQSHVFSVGNCFSNVSLSCNITGIQNVTVYPPSDGWREGYNYLQSSWSETDNASITFSDSLSQGFNAIDVYYGWYTFTDENGNYKYTFNKTGNLTVGLNVRNQTSNSIELNLTNFEYSTPSTSCWSESCRTYTSATYSIINQSSGNYTINGYGIIKIHKPSSSDWSEGYMYFRSTVNGSLGTVNITSGSVYIVS